MRDIRIPLHQFMPYGAPDLIAAAPRRVLRAIVTSAALWSFLFVAAVVVVSHLPEKLLEPIPPYDPPHDPQPPPRWDPEPPKPQPPTPPAPPAVLGSFSPVDDTLGTPESLFLEPALHSGNDFRGGPPGDAGVTLTDPGGAGGTGTAEPPRKIDFTLDEQPIAVMHPKPVYPDFAREAGVEGDVVLEVLVGADGTVRRIEILKSVPILDAAAVEGLRRWTFQPAIKDGLAVPAWVRIPIQFRLH